MYVAIITGQKLSSIFVAIMGISYWLVRSYSRRGGDRVKGVDAGGMIIILAIYRFYFIRIHDPSNNRSIQLIY